MARIGRSRVFSSRTGQLAISSRSRRRAAVVGSPYYGTARTVAARSLFVDLRPRRSPSVFRLTCTPGDRFP